jgi:CubicO group peptidase (beta-lactamase class C family)/D-alanyl-D-alanine dipeptidase
MRRLTASLLLLAACPALLHAQPAVPPAKGYEAAVKRLDAFIRRQVADKKLPALSIALVDDQKVVWARGYGHADPGKKLRATADTVYRVGSVSKLFTDLAVMQLVERGALDLDSPVTKYLPDFKPEDPFDKEITLRQLMSHRSGLVREPPVGNYFDPDTPSLEKTVRSLNRTRLVYEPGKKTKYSNAGIAVVGLALEQTQKQAFPRYLQRKLLDPLGMKTSAFEPDPEVTRHLSRAVMWTYHGREFPAPTFELGMAPAGSLYSSANDLARFLMMLFAGGKAGDEVILRRETLEKMWVPQFARKGEKSGFGIGFSVTRWEGRRRVGHGGAIYGFATDLSALPDDKLGVVVIAARDVANAVVSHVADVALKHMLAVRRKKPLSEIEETSPLGPGEARKLAGRYQSKDKAFDLIESAGRLYYLPARGGFRLELRKLGKALVTDDVLGYGQKVEFDGEKLRVGKDVYERVTVGKPGRIPAKWAGLIGEYGWDHNTLYVLEKDGKLHALIEWFFLYPLREESADVYSFPDFGLYQDEKLRFTRDRSGRATRVEAAGVVFERRRLGGEDGSTFKIKPARPLAELRKEALRARPPAEKGEFRKPDLVELVKLEPGIKLDVRYATTNNFLGTPFYTSAKAYLQRPAAEALVRVHRKLAKQGYGLLVFDGYRPWSVTKMFWDATPPDKRVFVANPAEGSRHNRGCAVDLTLYERKTGKPVEMVGGYDEMSDRSYADYPGGTSLQRYHRGVLRRAMESEGFTVYEAEWWHYDFKDWKSYPILNKTFEELGGGKGG